MPRPAALAILAILSTTLLAHSQAPAPATPPPAPLTLSPAADVLRSYTNFKTNILKSAQNMPEENYAFRPTPDVRTFARVVNHVTEAQFRSCGTLNAIAPASIAKPPSDTADKATILAALQASFAECDKAYAAVSEANMLEKFTIGTTTRARISMLWGNAAHDDEQYATLALYMRLKGLTPPSSEK